MNRFIVMPGGRPVRVFCLVWLILIITRGQAAADASIVYDPNPHHLWNRLNETLFDRTAQDGKKYGLDELDILYWRTNQPLPGFASQNPPPAQLRSRNLTPSRGKLQVSLPSTSAPTPTCVR